jgi:nicotinamidase-related amidase
MNMFDPRRTALLLMDFQNDIVARFDESDELLARVQRLRTECRDRGMHVAYVRVAFTEDDRRSVPSRNKAFAALASQPDRMADGSPGAEIVAELRPGDGELVVTKKRVGAFSTTNLASELAARSVDTLVLAGIATSGVVLSTVRDAADHDFALLVVRDCCADADPQVHEVLVGKVFPRQTDVVDAADLLSHFAT